MLRSKIVPWFLVAAAVALLVLCLPTTVLANGTKGGTVTPPTGRGPTEILPGLSVASISAIQQRGHVDNMCEEAAMMQDMVKQKGGQRTVGDYKVAYMLDHPEGWYEMTNGKLTWRPPAAGETQHIEVAVMDSLTGKCLPMPQVTADVIDQSGSTVQSQQLMYLWHPMVDHYGANFSIPNAGTYSLRVRAPAPDFRRHDQQLGDRFTSPLDVTFTNVKITPQTPEAAPTK